MMIIATVGKRSLTQSEQLYLESIGALLAERGHRITTGNAPGADQAFHLGYACVRSHIEGTELYLPWDGFEKKAFLAGQQFWTAEQALPFHVDLARKAHPYWNSLTQGAQRLMIRNAMIVARFDYFVDEVWAYPNLDKRGLGGTGHAMRCAEILRVPVRRLPGPQPPRSQL